MSVQNAIEVAGDPTALYRLFDAGGTLLYVGVTRDIPVRFAQHKIYKPWWPQVARKTMTWYGSRTEAVAAETAAIADEGPLHNIAGVPSEEDAIPREARRRDWSVKVRPAEAWLSGAEESAGESSSPRKVRRRPYASARLASVLTAKIRSGELAPGVELPPPADMQKEWRASARTVKKALTELQAWGLISEQGRSGIFVTRAALPGEVAPPAPRRVAAPAPRRKTVRQKTEKELVAERRLAVVRREEETGRLRGNSAEVPAPFAINLLMPPGTDGLDMNPIANGAWEGVSMRFPLPR